MVTGRSVALALVCLLSVGCGSRALDQPTTTTAPGSGPAANVEPSCTPTDQAQFVYRPARLQPLTACVHVTGTVVASSNEGDGDVHIQVRLDAPSAGLLRPGNQYEDGTLIVEPVCQFPPMQADAIRVCASDPDPLMGGLPGIGEHVWMEGRYILDLQHYAWAELHPLYRWGTETP
jgi:hypothetical protein